MRLRRFRRQYEQLSQFERGKIIDKIEVGWSPRHDTLQFGRSDCVVRRCWDQWMREMSFTRKPCPGRSRQISHGENRHIVRNARVQPTASHWPPFRHRIATPIMCAALDSHLSMPPFGVVPRTRKLDCSGIEPGRLMR
ncbi:transposable element Tcb2 transposase [Trichonephila clavipes]|nr:transposable element Tcb2 transposase [Trichonephila clavipes]